MGIRKGYVPKHKFWKNGRLIEGIEFVVKRPKTDEEIDDLIDEWHTGNSDLSLYEFLGWTKEEYKKYIEIGEIPK